MRTAKRQKREDNSRRYLGKPARAQTLWALVDGLNGHETLRPLGLHGATRLLRGQRMRRHWGQGGTFLSCMEKGARCKVLFDGKLEAEMVASEELFKVQIGAHPYAAALAFLVWNLFSVSQNQLRLARLRSDLGYHRGWGKIGRALLRMTTFSDPRLALQLTLQRWRSSVVQKEAERLRLERLQQVFKAWFEVLVMVKYNNAMDQLERTSEKLQTAKAKCLEAETRTEKMKGRLQELIWMDWDLWCSWVLFAWQWAVRLCRSTKDFALQARLRRAEQTLKLSDSFGQGSADLKPTFQAWSSLVKRDRKRKIMAARWMYGVGTDTLEEVFRAWRGVKYAEFERVSQLLRRKEQDFQELQGLSSHLYTFSQQSCGRAQRMESALLAAERAMELSATRGNDLERQVVELQGRLQQHQDAEDLQRHQYEFQVTRRWDAELVAQQGKRQLLLAELSASEDQQVHLHQQMGHLRAESEQLLRVQLEELSVEADALRSLNREHAELCEEAEARGREEEQQALQDQQLLAGFRERQRLALEKVRRSKAQSSVLRQRLGLTEPSVAELQVQQVQQVPVESAPEVPVESAPEDPPSEGCLEADEEDSGYTREEWMDFFSEEGLSADELDALEVVFDHLNISGDILVDHLKDAVTDQSIALTSEIRQRRCS